MMPGAVRACIESRPGFRLWHFQHGPIDLIIGAEGTDASLEASFESAWCRFGNVLQELVAELPRLRGALPAGDRVALQGEEPLSPVARRMVAACQPFARLDSLFITPMAAVAGSVAEEIVHHFRRSGVRKAWVNNGGDIAWHATPDEPGLQGPDKDPVSGPAQRGQVASFAVALAGAREDARLLLRPEDGCWGIATSGWRGRSQSLGIADSVTVLAHEAAVADAAATMVANAVCLHHLFPEHPAIRRVPASQVKDDSDLGEQLVTVSVGRLSDEDVDTALAAGHAYAARLLARGAIRGARMSLQGRWRVSGACQAMLSGSGQVPHLAG